jgi:predicted Zn-dependent peptidase
MISDILSRGNSSRLYKNLIKDKQLFSDIHAYVMGDFDKGLFVISGKVNDGISIEAAEAGIDAEILKIQTELVSEEELQKCKNKIESTVTYSEADVLNKATNLAISELLGDANLINLEIENYQKVTAEQIKEQANLILRKTNCSTLFYLKKHK